MDPESQVTTRQRRRDTPGDGDGSGDGEGGSAFREVDEGDRDRIKQRYKWREPAPDLSNTVKFIITAVFIGLSILFVKYTDGLLPTPLTLEDWADHPEKFIEERARLHIHDLTAVGPRVSGSPATDVHEVEEFRRILADIQLEKSDKFNLEFEAQFPTGTFFMDDDEGHTSSYSKIANVVAKLEPANVNERSNKSVLFNCHFDTKVGSPGATDNIISCATMLEMLRVLSQQEEVMPNTILFLFNGAEEYGLQGAHGFVGGRSEGDDPASPPGHKWSTNLKAFVNLEGAGAGGGEILFQSGPGNGWILQAYVKNAPHPYGLVIAEEAFQRNFIPSDTDFRIFRDFAEIPGLDMAFIKNGWVYHTKWDKLSEIPPGSIQHMGENALALAKYFGHLNFKSVEESDEKMVFFDLFGAFMVSYTETVGIIINFIIGFVGIVLALLEVLLFEKWSQHKAGFNVDKNQTKLQYYGRKALILLWLLVSTILSWGIGALVVYVVALVFSEAGYDKPFYSYPSVSFVIFGVPCVLTHILVYSFAHKGSVDRSWMAAKFTISLILIVGTFITRIVYVFSINLLFGFLGFYVARLLVLKSPLPKKNVQKLVIYLLIGELIPFTIACYLAVTLSDVFVPIMGRSGSETNANIYFGLIVSSVISIIGFSGLTSIFVSFKKSLLITTFLFSLLIINPLVVFGFIGKIPYQEKTPMRINVVDVDRIWYHPNMTVRKSDTAYWFWQVDSGTMDKMDTFRKTVYEVQDVIEAKADTATCEDLYCAMPFVWPATDAIKKTPMIMNVGEHPETVRDSVTMHVNEISRLPSSLTQYKLNLTFEGPSQTTVVLSPMEGYQLISWSLLETVPPSGVKWNGRSTYFVYHGKGLIGDNMQIDMVLEQIGDDDGGGGGDGALLDIALGGHFLHGPGQATPVFNDFVQSFPSWTYVMNWSSVMKLYTLSAPP